MSLRLALALLALVLPGRASVSPPKDSIAWEPQVETTLARAKEEKRVVFVAVNMDGERACDRLAEKTYREKALVGLAESTLNLVASPAAHAPAHKPCPRFPGTTCAQHQKVDVWARTKVLVPDASGAVIAPHHVFLDPEGKVVLSVPYEVTPAELAWCFATALRTASPKSESTMPNAARAPRRLILGGVFQPPSGGAKGPAPREEVLALVKEIKKGLTDAERTDALARILSSDEPEGIDLVTAELRASRDRASVLHMVGALSPPSYWEVVAEFAVGAENELRTEAAVALEQLAAPESLKVVQNALFKEDHPEIEKEWIRALAAAGSADAKVRKDLLKRASTEKDEVLRLNTIVALGSLAPGDDVASALETTLKTGPKGEKCAAACAMAISRDPKWIAALEAASAESEDAEVDEACVAATKALRQGGLLAIREVLKKVAKDVVERDRWFGYVR